MKKKKPVYAGFTLQAAAHIYVNLQRIQTLISDKNVIFTFVERIKIV